MLWLFFRFSFFGGAVPDFLHVLWWKSISSVMEISSFLKKMGGNPTSPNSYSPRPTFQYHRTTTELDSWPQSSPTKNCATIVKCLKSQRHHRWSRIEIYVKLLISLLYDGSVVLEGCVAVNLSLEFNLNLGILAETYGVNFIFLDWWHKIRCNW